jgi:hypothetical protein
MHDMIDSKDYYERIRDSLAKLGLDRFTIDFNEISCSKKIGEGGNDI